tara:strand:+ start:230 stop:574 length:345 start_codon:yes stop_codon:yes gene_type:complete
MRYHVIFIFIMVYFNIYKSFSDQRYICFREDTKEVINFFISDKKLYLSGLSISGTYSILTKFESGILALNKARIGEEVGIETVFLSLKEKSFSVKSIISKKSNNTIIQIKGSCN